MRILDKLRAPPPAYHAIAPPWPAHVGHSPASDARVLAVARDDVLACANRLRALGADADEVLDTVTGSLDLWVDHAQARVAAEAEAGCMRVTWWAVKWWLWRRWR